MCKRSDHIFANYTVKTTFFFLFGLSLNAQKVYYKTFEGAVLTEENYLANMKEIEKRKDLAGRVYEVPIKTEYKADSIIKHVKFEFITFARDKQGKEFDPYGFHRKMIGNHFPIETFKNDNGELFSQEHLKGKPTLINFWFTDCPPCVKEIPDLNNIKKNFGDSVNFLAITFEKRKKVEGFLKKNGFNYLQITDAAEEINELKIKAFPMTFLLNKNGEIVNIYGYLSLESEKLKNLLKLLL